MNPMYMNFLKGTALKREDNKAVKNELTGREVISLPDPGGFSERLVNFLETVELRGSVREYTGEALTMEELSYLLWCTQGVKMMLPNGITKRTVPSAGSVHEFTTYLYIDRVKDLAPGLYMFHAENHELVFLANKEEIEESVLTGFKNEALVKTSAATFMWAANLTKMEERFSNRGLRYLFLDAGHIAENLYLAAETLNLGVCAIGAFYDDALNAALALDGSKEAVLYAASVGRRYGGAV